MRGSSEGADPVESAHRVDGLGRYDAVAERGELFRQREFESGIGDPPVR